MNDLNVRHWTGAFGIAAIVLILLAQPLWVIGGPAPRLEETAQFSEYVSRNNMVILTRSLVDTLVVACFLIFLAGLRHLIRKGKTDGELVSTLVFGVGLVFAMLTLLGDALCAGAALDTVGGKAEPVVVRALWEASIPAFGAMGLIIMALFMASTGYAILTTRALPRWVGWLACIGAIGNLMAVPAIYVGTNAGGFYSADGMVSLLSELPFLIWVLSASISLIVINSHSLEARVSKEVLQ